MTSSFDSISMSKNSNSFVMYYYNYYDIYSQIWLQSNENFYRSSVLQFAALHVYGPVLEKNIELKDILF